ncbi:MAG: 50S ribosome-binding GTPase [Archaeoglobales archaeon]|nr:50S ribosome-binding GTPase [Archaeoglobales archaeon]
MEFRKLPTVLTAEELIDKIFRRASKVTGRSSKERALNKLATISNVTKDYFKKISQTHPSYEELPEFYKEMVDIVVGIPEIKKSLGALKWAESMVQRVISKGVREIRSGKDEQAVLKSVYGRVASIIEQIDKDLRFLNEAKQKLQEIPSLGDYPTVVVAGYPNVGKSSFVAAVSTAKPDIASYPFTTKKLSVGFLEMDGRRVQIIDTPGLLDRPISKRNEIEKRAIVALKYLADVVIFIIDPTEEAYSIEKQLSLLDEIKKSFEKPVIDVYSKADLHNFRDRPAFSALTGEGIEDILKEIKKHLKIE